MAQDTPQYMENPHAKIQSDLCNGWEVELYGVGVWGWGWGWGPGLTHISIIHVDSDEAQIKNIHGLMGL